MSVSTLKMAVLLILAFMPVLSAGRLQAQQPLSPSVLGDQEFRRQQELERQRRERREDETPDIHFQTKTVPKESLIYPASESPCFVINEITLVGDEAEKFQWALREAKKAKGLCLGSRGLNTLMGRMQNLIVENGFVTTRLAVDHQDLTSGRLELTVIPGRVREIRLADGSGRHISLFTLLPVKPGDILNIRDVEQGLENLKRLPNAEVDIQVAPGDQNGESDLVVFWKQGRPLRFSLGMDDSGSEYTGKMQGTATLSIDNSLGAADMFQASFSHNLEGDGDCGTRAHSFYYSLPLGYNQLAFLSNYSNYHQTVAGHHVSYVYSGYSRHVSLELSRLVHRNGLSKTTLGSAAFVNSSRNYIDDVELEIQRRRMAGWEAFIRRHQYLGALTLDGELRYHRGTGAFQALRAPEEEVGEGTSRPELLNFSLRGQHPIHLGGQNFRYVGQWRQQWALDRRLVYRDRFSIGGRYSVRGYDGDVTLAADNGFTFRNELGWNIADSGQELYAAFDIGRVWGGAMEEFLPGRTLRGGALGLRGAVKGLQYDLFMSTPISRPNGFPGSDLVTGFSLVWNF